MPCWTINTIQVKLAVADLDLFEAAMRKLRPGQVSRQGTTVFLGNGESFNKDTQELKVRAGTDVARIQQAYGAEIVTTRASKFGWQIRQTAEFEYEMVKR